MESWNSGLWNHITKNQHDRFHFLPTDAKNDMPNLILDFKHFYTVPREEIYAIHKTKYKISINALFREDISQRFANYLSRIGLPFSPSKKVCAIENGSQKVITKQSR